MVGKEQGSNRGGIGKRLVNALFLALAAGTLHAQESRTWEITPDRIIIGDLDRVKATCVVDIAWSENLRLEYPPEKEEFYYLSDPQIEPVTEGPHTGKAQVTVALRANKRGIYLLAPFAVKDKSGGREILLDPLILTFLQADEKDHRFPIDVLWAGQLPESLYVGQPLFLVLLMKNTREILVPDSIRLPTPQTGVLEQETYSPPIESIIYGGLRLYSVPVAVWVFTPTEPGRIMIPPAQVQLGDLVRTTLPVYLDILPLPKDLESTGAIGKFRISLEADAEKVVVGDYLTVTVTVEGSGNLHYLKIPEPEINPASGLKLVSTDEENRLTPVTMGYTGSRILTYRYQCLHRGSCQINLDPFVFMDPDNKILSHMGTPGTKITILDSPADNPEEEGQKAASRIPFPAASLSLYDLKLDHHNLYLFIFLLPGLLLIVFFYLERWGIKRQTLKVLYGIFLILGAIVFLSSLGVHFFLVPHPGEEAVEKGNLAFYEKAFDEALFFYQEALTLEPGNPAIFYNLGLIYQEKGDRAAAIFHLRKALCYRSWDRNILGLLVEMEQEEKLENDTIHTLRMIPEIFFFACLVCINLFFILIYLYLRTGKIRMALTGLFNLLLFVLLLSVFVGSVYQKGRPFAVIRNPATEMKKAPSVTASRWLEINKGISVKVIAEIDDYILVRTIYGVEGWIKKEDLWY